MRRKFMAAWTLALVCGVVASEAQAQRGMGDATGLARQAVRPELVALSGKLVEVDSGPCENTTGHALVGTHILLDTGKGQTLNIHLGPEADVAPMVAKLTVGQSLTVQAFRTEKLPADQYIAQVIRAGDAEIVLRDGSLRPVWAGSGRGRGRAGGVAATPAADGQQAIAPRAGRGGGPPPWAGRGRGRGMGRGMQGQGGMGRGMGGGWGMGRGAAAADPAFDADRAVFHGLLDDHGLVRRTVTLRDDGIEAVTESDDPRVAEAIQAHVAAMHRRLEQRQPIHMRDPLFAALFAHADQIELDVTNTPQGVRVVETSPDPYVVKLIQAHADAVSGFAANGFAEARMDHAVPAR